MKNLSKVSFIVLIGLIHLTQTILSDECIQRMNPLDSHEYRVVECPKPSPTNKRQIPTDNNMFSVTFQCLVSDQTLCNKVENVFHTAGQFITATLNLKQTVTVNATFLNFCDPAVARTISPVATCDDPTRVVLGAAGPAMLNQFTDSVDGKVRLYPQALYKQFDTIVNQNIKYDNYDIMAIFNSQMDYWFEGDPLPMKDRQADMLLVVTHELVHGLGFTTAWDDHFNLQALIPSPALLSSGFRFMELIFDKYIILTDGNVSLTSQADELNKFQVDFQTVRSDDQLIQSFRASPQFSIAQGLFTKATTKGSMVFKTNTNVDFVLETSLVPFQPSSSIGHSDFDTYGNSSDFLMVFKSPRATLGQMMSRADSTNTTGPIGPNLRQILQTIGYELKPEYIPPVMLQSSEVSTSNENPYPISPNSNEPIDSSINSDSSHISFNFLLTLVCILFTCYLF